MTAPGNCFTIYHGKLQVNVPYDLFESDSTNIIPEKAEEFKKTIMARYPWISENAMDVIFNNAQREMQRMIDERREKKGAKSMDPVKDLPSEILKTRRALYKEPENAALWMRLGELLCKNGDIEEGYEALNKAKSLAK